MPRQAQIVEMRPSAPRAPADDGPVLRSFGDVVKLAGKMRDAKLRTELESYVHIVSFKEGRIALRLHDAAPKDLANRLTLRLKEWTERQWVITVTSEEEGAETLRDARTREVMAHPMVKHALDVFPGARVTAIRETELAVEPAPDDADDERPVDPDDDEVAEAAAKRKETGKA